MDHVEIFNPECIKKIRHPPVVKEDEVEVFSIGSVEEAIGEEEQLEEDEEIDYKLFMDELECLKKRIQFMQRKLKLKTMVECPEEPCVDPELELNCSPNVEICGVQKKQYRLQCQINELVRSATMVRDLIKDLRVRMCEKNRQIANLEKEIASLNSWRLTLEHEFGVCIERFEYLKHVKVECKDLDDYMKEHQKEHKNLEKKFITKRYFKMERREFLSEMCCTKKLFREYFHLQNERFEHLSQTVADLKKTIAANKSGKDKVKKEEAKKEIKTEKTVTKDIPADFQPKTSVKKFNGKKNAKIELL